jgi:hypothetical protein
LTSHKLNYNYTEHSPPFHFHVAKEKTSC